MNHRPRRAPRSAWTRALGAFRLGRGWHHWPAWVGLGVALLTSAGYVRAWQHADASWAFTGFLFAVDDGLSYLAKMRLGAQGAWLFRTPYTTEPTVALPAFTAYLALGHVLPPRAPYGAFVVLFHLFRLVALAGLMVALHRVLTWLLPARPRLQAAVAVWTLLGGGLGWLLYPLGLGRGLGWAPLSFYSPEAFGFLAVWGLPHLTAARALWLYAWWAFAHQHLRRAFAAATALLFFQPLYIVPLALLWSATAWGQHTRPTAAAQWRTLAAATSLWAAYWAFMLWARATDPVVQAWDAQNNVRLVPWPAFALAYGPWLPWVARGWRLLQQEHPGPARALAFWLAAVALLIWLPTSVQRRLLEGVWWAWGLLAVKAAAAWHRGLGQGRRWLAWAPLGLTALSPALLLGLAWHAASRPSEPLFRPRAELAAMQAWGQQAPLAAGVLASYPSSTLLPAAAAVRAPLGHPVESPAWAERRAQTRAFFQPTTTDAQRQAWLADWRVEWVWWGPRERALGAWDPRTAPYLEPAFHDRGYWVFRVRP